MERFGLVSSSVYKSLTVDKKRKSIPENGGHKLDLRLKKVFDDPLEIPSLGKEYSSSIPECDSFFKTHIKCDREEAFAMCEDTIGQSKNSKWFSARKYRISASKARQIAYGRKDETILKYFFNSINDNKYLRYGRTMEPLAKKKYEEVTSKKIVETGLFINPEYSW
jgi:hypothetical protein